MPIARPENGVEAAAGSVRSAGGPAGDRRLHLVVDPSKERPTPADLESLSNEKLVAEYRRNACVTCLDVLLRRNEKLCHHVLKRFSHTDEPYEDLFQVARVGLIKAAQRFEISYGTAFSTYAVPLVDGEIRHYLRDSLLVRQPRWAKALYERIQQFQVEFLREHRRSPCMSEVAEGVNVHEEGVLEIIRFYGSIDTNGLEDILSSEEGRSGPDPKTIRAIRQENFSLPIEERIMLYQAMSALSEAHRKMIYLLFFRDLTQQEVADELGISQRTVSREQSKALGRLKGILSKKIF